MKIRAAVTRAPHAPLSLETLEIEAPRADEVLIRISAVGVCHTDIAMRDQLFPVPQPIVLGHEGAGVVEAVGSDAVGLAVGDHVVMSYASCGGECAQCKCAAYSYCERSFPLNFGGARLDGSTSLACGTERVHSHFFGQSSFAEYVVCSARHAVKVPKDAPLELLGPLGCGVMTGAGAVIHALDVGVGESIAVFGVGSVGLSAVMAARLVGAGTIIAIDVNPQRLALAEELGASHTVNARTREPEAAIREALPGGVRFALDTTARPETIRAAIASLSARGTCGLLGASAPTDVACFSPVDMVSYGKSVRGIVEGDAVPAILIPRLIELHRQGRFPFDKLVKFYPFEAINEAIHDAETGKTVKPILLMRENSVSS
jgi:aryl-alcohol dehydrogenase